MDWTGHRKTFFFLLFTNTQFDQLQGATSTCTPSMPLLTIDVEQMFAPMFALGLGLARPR
jgi:hypothetical protein